jgi:hypothetical protein
MVTHKQLKYQIKLLDIQRTLTLVDTDAALIVTISKEMAFHWVPSILNDLNMITKENSLLKADNLLLNQQNDSLLLQNLVLSQQLNHQ